jgi:hypothetical protein
MKGVHITTVAVKKQLSITYSERMPAVLFKQMVKRMHLITLSSVAYPTLPHFTHYFIYGTIFGKKKLSKTKFAF